MFQVGDEVRVKVLKFDPETERVCLGLKQIQEDPWHRADEKYPVGTRVSGKVVSLTDYGAFIELEQGIEGLVHVSEMTWTKRVKHPSKLVARAIRSRRSCSTSTRRRRSIARHEADRGRTRGRCSRTSTRSARSIKGKVRNVTDFGVFVGIEEGIDGLVHVSDMSWTQRIKHPGEKFKKGDEVEAVVLNIDVENERFSLGIKQAHIDPWTTLADRHPVGSRVKGKVTKVTDFGAFVEIEPGIEGLPHPPEKEEGRAPNPRGGGGGGGGVDVKVIDMDLHERKVALSIKQLNRDGGEDDYREYLRRQGDGRASRRPDGEVQPPQVVTPRRQARAARPPGRAALLWAAAPIRVLAATLARLRAMVTGPRDQVAAPQPACLPDRP